LQQQAVDAVAAARAAQAELQQMKDAQQAVAVATVAAQPASAAPSASANAFNPPISLILNGLYENHSQDPLDYQRAGFPVVGEGGPVEQGLGLGESEFTFSATVDDKFYCQLTLALESEDGGINTATAESYVETTALPEGFLARAGRFYS